MIIIYVGDISNEVCIAAKSLNNDAKLITHENYNEIKSGVFFTSLGDCLTISIFRTVLAKADKIVYIQPQQWSDEKNNNSSMQRWTEFYLRIMCDKVSVMSNTPLYKTPKCMELIDKRKSDDQQMWIVGCSITYGVGVKPDQNYGSILADRLQLPVSFLARSGSSVDWAKDQILRSDIRPKDIVIWGVTSWNRFVYYEDEHTLHINVNAIRIDPEITNKIDIRRLDERDLFYKSILSCYQVANFCQKIGADLYFAGLLVDDEFLPYLMNLPNYTQFYGCHGVDPDNLFIDTGTDRLHPGVKTHQWFADTLFDQITRNR